MARCKGCVVKRKKRKRERGEEKEGKIGDQIGIKCPCAAFSSAQSSFFCIRNTLFRIKHTISPFVFMQDVFDEQIM